MRLRLLTLCLLLLCALSVSAQRTLVFPVTFNFGDISEKKKATVENVLLGSPRRRTYKPDEEIIDQYRPGLQKTLETYMRQSGQEVVILTDEDMDEKLRGELAAVEQIIRYSYKSSAMLIGRKSYEDRQGSNLSGFFNELADKYDIDQILFVYADAMNERKNFKDKNKDPVGSGSASTILFDANSALVLKRKSKAKGDGENRVAKFKITPASMMELITAALNKTF